MLKCFVYKSGEKNSLMSSRSAIMASATSYPQLSIGIGTYGYVG